MLVLGIDTSGPAGGSTLANSDAGTFRVIESAAFSTMRSSSVDGAEYELRFKKQ